MDAPTTIANSPADCPAEDVASPYPYPDTAGLAPSEGEGSGAFIRRLIGLGLQNDAVATLARAHFPARATTGKSVQWYRCKLYRERNGIFPPEKRSAQRSRVGNGHALLSGVDGRNVWVRRCKELIADHVSDLGGADACSSAERSIVRRACVLTVELERLEKKFALAGEASADDLDLYSRAAGNLRRMLEALGLQRRARDVTPSLTEILREAR